MLEIDVRLVMGVKENMGSLYRKHSGSRCWAYSVELQGREKAGVIILMSEIIIYLQKAYVI